MSSAPSGAVPRGLIARLRHQIGPLLPPVVRHAAAQLLKPVESRRGAIYEVAGQRLRFLPDAAPVVVKPGTDERQQLDALQLNAFAAAIKPGDLVADVGAYRGTYTVVAAARVGERGRVVAFEPTAANASIIKANLRLNGFGNRVRVEKLAVSDEVRITSFYADADSSTNSLWPSAGRGAEISVRTTSLDEYFRGQPPNVVKIDVEGAELQVLRGARRILDSDAFIICELHPYAWSAGGYNAEDLRTLLAQHGRYLADVWTRSQIAELGYGVALLLRHK